MKPTSEMNPTELSVSLSKGRETKDAMQKRIEDLHKALHRNRKDKVTCEQIRRKIQAVEKQMATLDQSGKELENRLKLKTAKEKLSKF